VIGAFVGPIVSLLSFVCSVGNVPMAAVLWGGGISFGGVIAFIFAELLIIPILNIYRKYYGTRMMIFLAIASYITMALAGLIIEGIFGAIGLIPQQRMGMMSEMSITWNYTTILNIIAILSVIPMLMRFLKTGGPAMLDMMDMSEAVMAGHHHHHGDHHNHGDHHGHEHHHHDSHAHHAEHKHDCCEEKEHAPAAHEHHHHHAH
jgi:uncharacterized membrane protein YraQ (UPF0718 family)